MEKAKRRHIRFPCFSLWTSHRFNQRSSTLDTISTECQPHHKKKRVVVNESSELVSQQSPSLSTPAPSPKNRQPQSAPITKIKKDRTILSHKGQQPLILTTHQKNKELSKMFSTTAFAPNVVELLCLDTISITDHFTISPASTMMAGDDDICTPSTVCSVMTTSTAAAQSPQKTLMTAPPTPMAPNGIAHQSHSISAKSWEDVADVVARCVATVAQTQMKKPSDAVMAKMTEALATVAHSLLLSGCTTADELSLACVLICRASRSDRNPQGLIISSANARRVLVSAVRLSAKAHSDEYYSISTMCAAGGLPKSADFVAIMAESEWKLFAALDMNCFVTATELSDVFSALL